MLKNFTLIGLACLLFFACKQQSDKTAGDPWQLKVSTNHRFFETGDGKPFFWLGDTGWLLLSKLNREEAIKYLDARAKQGFNVIQVMVVHSSKETNAYGDSALVNRNIAQPKTTPDTTFGKKGAYDYWDHVDWIVAQAEKRGIYIALVPVWGSVVKGAKINANQGEAYAKFLAERYRGRPNIIWMNGGDIAGSDSTATWQAIGNTIRSLDTVHLITYHPRGRTQSSTWFHNEKWLDFNTFQSGHRIYAQDTMKKDLNYGEDNWKYAEVDYAKTPTKPTLDAEPSYEGIPYGLHDTTLPRWTDAEVRRYGYWSVFAGGCGYTYGHNDVMQMHKPADKEVAYGSTGYWDRSIFAPGAKQMIYIKQLMLSRPYFDRVPDQSLIASGQGERYERLIATRGKNYAFIYTYTGRDMSINAQKLASDKVKASWFDPRTGKVTEIGTFENKGALTFNPPGEKKNGNDWILIIDAI
jgi:hypothetical protein